MADNAVVPVPKGAVAIREEFGVTERKMQAELAGIAMAARVKAEVEARYVMAERHPRDLDNVRVNVLRECARPEFMKAARYKIPNRGEGFTIRFAEACAQHMRNMYMPTHVIYEDETQRIIEATTIDLETNNTWQRTVTISKTIERKEAGGRDIVRIREKRDGSIVYVVLATDDELRVKEGSEISKAQRTNILRLVPPDILEEAKSKLIETSRGEVRENPDKVRKQLADAFAAMGIMPSHLKAYLGTELSQLQPDDLHELRELYNAIKGGHTTWREVMAAKSGEAEPEGNNAAPGDKTKDRLKKKQSQAIDNDVDEAKAKRQSELDALPDLESHPDSMDYKPGDVVKVKGKFYVAKLDLSAWEDYKP